MVALSSYETVDFSPVDNIRENVKKNYELSLDTDEFDGGQGWKSTSNEPKTCGPILRISSRCYTTWEAQGEVHTEFLRPRYTK